MCSRPRKRSTRSSTSAPLRWVLTDIVLALHKSRPRVVDGALFDFARRVRDALAARSAAFLAQPAVEPHPRIEARVIGSRAAGLYAVEDLEIVRAAEAGGTVEAVLGPE